jgi:hypothetical protein
VGPARIRRHRQDQELRAPGEAETAQRKAPVVLPPAKPGLVDFRRHVVHELTPSTIAVFTN